MTIKTAIIERIEDQGFRVLLYPVQKPSWSSGEYHIIAPREILGKVKPGDKVEYEPDSVNFGWIIGLGS